jgi:hypothetical protein
VVVSRRTGRPRRETYLTTHHVGRPQAGAAPRLPFRAVGLVRSEFRDQLRGHCVQQNPLTSIECMAPPRRGWKTSHKFTFSLQVLLYHLGVPRHNTDPPPFPLSGQSP